MTDEEKEALEELKEELNKPVEVPENKFDTFILYNIENARIILNLIEKQSKMIDLMAEQLTSPINGKEWVIKYYEDRVENEKNV